MWTNPDDYKNCIVKPLGEGLFSFARSEDGYFAGEFKRGGTIYDRKADDTLYFVPEHEREKLRKIISDKIEIVVAPYEARKATLLQLASESGSVDPQDVAAIKKLNEGLAKAYEGKFVSEGVPDFATSLEAQDLIFPDAKGWGRILDKKSKSGKFCTMECEGQGRSETLAILTAKLHKEIPTLDICNETMKPSYPLSDLALERRQEWEQKRQSEKARIIEASRHMDLSGMFRDGAEAKVFTALAVSVPEPVYAEDIAAATNVTQRGVMEVFDRGKEEGLLLFCRVGLSDAAVLTKAGQGRIEGYLQRPLSSGP